MRLRLMGMIAAAVIATPVIAAPTPSAGAAPADGRGSAPIPRTQPAAASSAAGPQQRPAAQYYVDLNSASRKELMTLPGVGAAEAGRIIANRPYLTKTDLVAKNVLTIGPYVALKHLVVAMPANVAKQAGTR